MGIRDRRFFAVPMLAVFWLVAGCSSSEPQVIDESKYEDLYDDDADSGDEDESDDDFPDPPELPDAVKHESDDGAIAAAEYFLDAYEYAYHTGEMTAFNKIFGDECRAICDSLSHTFEQHADKGYRAEDAKFIERDISGNYTDEDGTYVRIESKLVNLTIADREEKVVEEYPDTAYSFIVLLNYSQGYWEVIGADFGNG